MIRIYLLEDQEIYLEGLMLLLEKNPELHIVGHETSAQSFLKNLSEVEADVFLLDVHLPDADAEIILDAIRKTKPTQKVIYLTMMRGRRHLHKLEKLGFEGYLLKNASIVELTNAIEIVAKGGQYFSPEMEQDQVHLPDYRQTITVNAMNDILTSREIEVLQLICREFSNAEIADKLFLSVGTIDTHRKNIIQKLGVHNTVGLVKYAIKNQLLV
jgi:two-component system response regulator NreC